MNIGYHFIKNSFNLIVCIYSLLQINFTYSQYWNRIPTPTNAQLNRCSFPDTLNGWAAGDSGTIIHSSNGGFNWFKQNSTINFSIQEIFFLNPRLGWCVANDFFFTGTMILKTTDGGQIWSGSRYPDTTYIINTVFFVDSLNGYLAGYNGLILKTTNGGISWLRKTIQPNYFSNLPIRRFSFYNPQFGLSCGGIMDVAGIIWRTTDSGNNWTVIDTTFEPLYDIKYFNNLKAFSCGGDYEYGSSLSTTSNNGDLWLNRTYGYIGIANSIAFRNGSEFWMPLGFSRFWMYTLDTGKSWSILSTTDSSGIFDVKFVDTEHGWACGQNGTILKYNTLIGIKKYTNIIPSRFFLFQNYPNPFNSNTIITYDLPINSNVKIFVYDVLGKLIETLVNQEQPAGTYKIEWKAVNKPSGVYFYKLFVNGIIFAKKMVLNK